MSFQQVVPYLTTYGEGTGQVSERSVEEQAADTTFRERALLLQLTRDAIVVRAYSDARIKFWNRSATDLYGWTEQEALGEVIHELLQSKYPEPLKDIEQKLATLGRWEGEIIHTTKKGIELVVHSKWSIVRDIHKQPVSILELNSDMTERKRAELSARENERLAGLGMASAIFAHEIANPLNGISTNLQMVEFELKSRKDLDRNVLANLHFAIEEIRRLGELLNEFRSLSRPQTLNVQPTNLVQAIHQVLIPEMAAWRATGITIKRDCDETLPQIMLDEDKMKQVILNICKNAVEAMPEGGTLTLACYESGDRIILEISDTGRGIPKDLDPFQLFTTTKPTGTGLGLPLVHQIITAQGGQIEYTSAPDKGTTFTISFPLTSTA